MKPNESMIHTPPEFFLCWMHPAENLEGCTASVKHSKEIADDIVKLPKEEVVTWIGLLGYNFCLMYEMIREHAPELAEIIKKKTARLACQEETENE
tara:strand:- start:954 stop:1241 length:288 start_codon:yes stop_codon:yes gene_type:complete